MTKQKWVTSKCDGVSATLMAYCEGFDDKLLNVLRELGEDIPASDKQRLPEDYDEQKLRNRSQNPAVLPSLKKKRLCDMTNEELKSVPIIELNQMLRECTETEAQEIRRRRRSLKNRDYALSSRQKRVEERDALERGNEKLKSQLSGAREEQARIIAERDTYRKKSEVLEAAWSRLSECIEQTNCEALPVSELAFKEDE